jgi:hypothetical protein
MQGRSFSVAAGAGRDGREGRENGQRVLISCEGWMAELPCRCGKISPRARQEHTISGGLT